MVGRFGRIKLTGAGQLLRFVGRLFALGESTSRRLVFSNGFQERIDSIGLGSHPFLLLPRALVALGPPPLLDTLANESTFPTYVPPALAVSLR